MQGTLLVGDYLFVSKASYGYSRYSLPWGYLWPLGDKQRQENRPNYLPPRFLAAKFLSRDLRIVVRHLVTLTKPFLELAARQLAKAAKIYAPFPARRKPVRDARNGSISPDR